MLCIPILLVYPYFNRMVPVAILIVRLNWNNQNRDCAQIVAEFPRGPLVNLFGNSPLTSNLAAIVYRTFLSLWTMFHDK